MKHELAHIFTEAKRQDRKSQKYLYEYFSGKMLGIAYSYVGNQSDAEDIVINAFYKAFVKIEDCQSVEHFQFWLRKIVINDAISFIRRKKNIVYMELEDAENYEEELEEVEIDIEKIFEAMPLGYKLVFNLAIFENKKHSEIAEILNITEGTSKSQLNKAKKWLKEYIRQKQQ